MQEEEPEQLSIKEAISFKKDKHRVEIRRKNIKNALQNKRVNHYNQCQQFPQSESNQQQVYLMKNNQNMENEQMPNSNEGGQGNEITLQFYINTINQICDSTGYVASEEKIIRCLKVLRTHVLFAIKETNQDEQDKNLILFMRSFGCECILQFLTEKYDQSPSLQAEAMSIIGNIFSLTNKPILSFLVQSGIISFIQKLLIRLTEIVVKNTNEVNQIQNKIDNQGQSNDQNNNNNNVTYKQNTIQIDQLRLRNEVLSELFRTLANMAGESYEYRIELIQNKLIRYFVSDLFNSLCQQMSKSQIEQILFLIKNMVNESPCINEEFTEQLIPILTALFLQPELSLDAIQDGIIAIKSYAKYGNTISRAKMLSNRDVFIKIHQLIDYSHNQDYANIFYALQTLRDYLKYSNRQAEFVFNLNGDQIFISLEFLLSGAFQGDSLQKDEAQKQIIDLQIQVIDIVHLYIICDDPEFFSLVFEKGIELIKQVIHIATFHPNNRINFKAKDLLFNCIARANYLQQQYLVQLDILQPVKDAIQEDELSFMAKGLRSISHLLQVEECQVEQNLVNQGQNINIRDILDDQYQIKQVFESLQAHPNQDISEQALFLLENYYQL